ncbi:MAG: pyridoxamine 5'-phosphate oxidase family protein [Methanomassiliicoccaceae archaeon]|nr:pyridoxamine 5'-phosphate oxidase family protein [Methanomassiliicoccaceae archaeon]
MRRDDREIVGTDGILAVLDGCDVVRIGLCADGRPYIVPMNFAFETVDGSIFLYFHCAAEGRKIDIIRKNGDACFEADRSYALIRNGTACRWSNTYESVMGEGTIEIVVDRERKVRALDLLMRRYGYGGTPHYDERNVENVTVLRMTVVSIAGKSKT